MPDTPSPKPSLSALRTLVSVAVRGSLTSASDSLGVTISAVSRQMAQLETTLGAQLMDRSARPVKLSPVGRQYAEALIPAFQSIDRVTADMFMKQLPSTVTLTTYPLFAVKWLLPRLTGFHLAHPNIELALRSTNRVIELKTGEADVAIRLGAGRWDGSKSMKLMSERVVAVCAPKLLRGRRGSVELLRSLPLIVSDRAGGQWRSWLARHRITGVRVAGSQMFDDPLAALEAAILGGGVTLTLRSMVNAELADGRLIEVLPTTEVMRLDHYVVVRNEAQDRPAVGVLLDWLRLQAAVANTAPQVEEFQKDWLRADQGKDD
ncbi:MAG: LysR substrate-binding domain-containing protein [Rhodoferax sp.]